MSKEIFITCLLLLLRDGEHMKTERKEETKYGKI